ncbi:MAG: leader peptidase (prepilin peptidase) / N-methyltransferase [Micromonosporaceae bacterium]
MHTRSEELPGRQDPPSRSPCIRRSRMLLAAAGTPTLRWLVARLAVQPGAAWRTTCDGCGAGLGVTGEGWMALLPAGRCGRCGEHVGAPPYALEVVAVVAVVVVVLAAPSPLVLLAGLAWAACAVPLVFIDARVHRLPDVLTYPAAAATLGLLFVEAATAGQWDRLARSAGTAAAFGGAVLLTALLGRRGLGVGDAKLLTSTAALLGWWSWGAALAAVFLGLLAASLAGVVLLLAGRAARSSQMALGPFLIAGTLFMLAVLAWARPA